MYDTKVSEFNPCLIGKGPEKRGMCSREHGSDFATRPLLYSRSNLNQWNIRCRHEWVECLPE